MSQNLMLFYMQWVPKVQTMNQPNFWRELKWLGCKLTMVGPPFWIGKIGNNSVYGGGGEGVAETGEGLSQEFARNMIYGNVSWSNEHNSDSPAIHIKTALIQSPHIPIERTLHRALQVVHFRGGVWRELLDTWYQADKSK